MLQAAIFLSAVFCTQIPSIPIKIFIVPYHPAITPTFKRYGYPKDVRKIARFV